MRRGFAAPRAALALCGLVLTAAPAAAVDSFFDVFTEAPIFGPPYPTSPVTTLAGTNFGGTFEATQAIEVGIASLSLDALPPEYPFIGRGQAGGGGAGGQPPSIDSFFDVFFEVDLDVSSTGREVSNVRIVHPPATPPGTWRLVPINPGPPGSIGSFFDVLVDPSFFDITYRVADDTGEHTYHVHGTSPSGRMSFFDVFVELQNPNPYPNGTVDSFFDVFVDFQMFGPQTSAPDLRMHTTGTFQGGETPVAGQTWGAIKALYR
jgi:hypothetical protein